MEGSQSRLTLQLWFPQQWATNKEQDVACPQSCTEWVVPRFLSMQTSEIGVDVTVDFEIVIWGNDGTLVCSIKSGLYAHSLLTPHLHRLIQLGPVFCDHREPTWPSL